MLQVVKELDSYLLDFELFERDGAKKWPSWVHQIRKAAISRFAELGFPTIRHENSNIREEWRYTSVAPIARIRFKPAEYALNGLTAETLARVPFGALSSIQLVFVNGHYAHEFSSLGRDGSRTAPTGVEV